MRVAVLDSEVPASLPPSLAPSVPGGWRPTLGSPAPPLALRNHSLGEQSTPGWSAWRTTVPNLERLIRTALSYFVANDLYTASCRFLKHAKGSFGLVILSSLEPDR